MDVTQVEQHQGGAGGQRGAGQRPGPGGAGGEGGGHGGGGGGGGAGRPGGTGAAGGAGENAAAAQAAAEQAQRAQQAEVLRRAAAQAQEAAQRRAEEDARRNQGAAQVANDQEYYRERPAPAYTGHALDRSLRDLVTQNSENEPKKGWGRGTLPFVIGAGAEVTRNTPGYLSQLIGNIWMSSPVQKAMEWAGIVGKSIGDANAAVPLEKALSEGTGFFLSTGGAAAIVTGVALPSISLFKRIVLGENAWRQAARYTLRKDEKGLINRLVRGAESWAIKKVLFKEDRYMKQLLKFADGTDDINNLNPENTQKINNLIAAGMTAAATHRLAKDLDMDLSAKDQERMDRFERMYTQARQIFDTKIMTAARKETVANDIVPRLVANRERNMWMKQTALMTGVGMAKAVSMVGLLQLASIHNIQKAFEFGGSIAKSTAAFADGVLKAGLKSAGDLGTWTVQAIQNMPVKGVWPLN